MEEEEEELEKIEFSFPILFPIGRKVRVKKANVDQTYFECPDYILTAEEGEVVDHVRWSGSMRAVQVKFTKMVGGYKPCIYNLPNSYLERVK